jgi:CheY-like chemotaxis protein
MLFSFPCAQTPNPAGKKRHFILVAEDRDEDVQILKLAAERAGVSLPLRFVRNGQEAIDYLNGAAQFADRARYPLPRLLLLDLQMPLLDGFQVLEGLRVQPGLRRLLVIIFTSSNLPEDVDRAFDLGANSYLVKPADFGKLGELVRHLEYYWVRLNQCPDCGSTSRSPSSGMRVLLRDPRTSRYYVSGNKWSDDPGRAVNFEHSERAAECGKALLLSRFELVIELRDGLWPGGGKECGQA